MKTSARRLSCGILAVFVMTWAIGCLSTSYFAMILYDEAKDEFTVLNVYQGISAERQADSQYLYHLWLNRDHLIRVPNIDILSMPAFLRLSATQYAPINLGVPPKELETTATTVSLDEIRVMPGTFFLRDPDTLCYYDQVVVPGKVIDQYLSSSDPDSARKTAEFIDKELKRRQDGGDRVEWESFRSYWLKYVHGMSHLPEGPGAETAPAETEEPKSNPFEVLDEESLQLLRKGILAGAIKITRDKQVFRLCLPLSTADVRQVEKTWRAIGETVKADAAKASGDAGRFAFIASKVQPAFALTAHAKSVELKINLATIIEQLPILASITKPLDAPKPEDLPRMRDTIANLRAHDVPIDDKLTVEELARGFATGALKSYPSEHPVKPGTGLVQEQRE